VKNFNELLRRLAKEEGKKKEVGIGQLREILRILADLEPEGALEVLKKYAQRRNRG